MAGDGALELRVLLVGEDRVHGALGDALLRVAWQSAEQDPAPRWPLGLSEYERGRVWVRLDEPAPAPGSSWHPLGAELPTHWRGRPLKRHLRVEGRPLGAGGARLQQWLSWAALQDPPPDLVLLIQDTDGKERLASTAAELIRVAQARGQRAVIGTPHPEGESWLLAAWSPGTPRERERLQRARQILGFDPTRAPHRLSSSPRSHADSKRVLRFVLLGEGEALTADSPPSRAPNEHAVELAEQLAARLAHVRVAEDESGLTFFVEGLNHTLRAALSACGGPRSSPPGGCSPGPGTRR